MTTTLKIKRFNLKGAAKEPSQRLQTEGQQDVTPATQTAESISNEIENIRREGLSARQLRTARRLAQQQDLNISSDLDAVRQLRARGIDPFQDTPLLQIVNEAPQSEDLTAKTSEPRNEGAHPSVKPIEIPTTAPDAANENYFADIAVIQRDIARRRRLKSTFLTLRLLAFVILPAVVCGFYYMYIATPLYATHSEFVIQHAAPANAGATPTAGGSMLTGTQFATAQDSIAVQGYLQSRDAMLRLNKDLGYITHFSDPGMDPIQRLATDATIEQAYKQYQKNVKISYDPTEGIIRMEVLAADPDISAKFSKALIGYAEEQVDHLTQRLRGDQMSGARESYEEANAEMMAAQRRVVDLQQKFKVMSSELEVNLISTQIGQLETQLTQDRLSLAQMEANESPNQARMEPLKRRIETITAQIAMMRARLTEGQNGAESLAQVQAELIVAQANVETRQMILQQSVHAMESARREANRQVRYLSLSVSPIPPDEAAYPKAFENTLVALLIFAGIYLMISMTGAILREQISS